MNNEALWLAVGSVFAGLTFFWMMYTYFKDKREAQHRREIDVRDGEHRERANEFYTSFSTWKDKVNDDLGNLKTGVAVLNERVNNAIEPRVLARARKK